MGPRRAVLISLVMVFTTITTQAIERALLHPHSEGEWIAAWTRLIAPRTFSVCLYSLTLLTIFFAKKEWPLAYALVYIFPLATFYSANRGSYWNMIWLVFFIVPILETVVGPDESNPTSAEARVLNADPRFKWVTWIWVPIQVTFILWACFVSSSWVLPWYHWLGFAVAVGLNTGVLGINIAHELIHKNNWLEQTLGKTLLVSVCYGHFFIEHIQGHHRFVSTDLDPATSHYGETFYRFWPRSVHGSFVSAWHLEAIRLEKAKLPLWSIHNEMIHFVCGSAVFCVGVGALWGMSSSIMFLAQSLVAFSLLEIVNYIEHYGLTRRQLGEPSSSASGKPFNQATAIREKIHFEAVTPRHSWNADTRITNLFLFKLQRHSDHHAYASRRYQILRSFAEAPQMPTGYAGMLVMALIPPIWFRVMNHRVLAYRKAESERIAALNTQPAEVIAEAKVAAVNAGKWRQAALMEEDLEGESDALAKTKEQYAADRERAKEL